MQCLTKLGLEILVVLGNMNTVESSSIKKLWDGGGEFLEIGN